MGHGHVLDTLTPQAVPLPLCEPPKDAMRPVRRVGPYLGGPRSLFRFCLPASTAGDIGRVNVVHGGVAGHSRGVGGFEPVAATAMDARRLQNIGDVFGIIDAIELVFEFGGDIHLDEVDIVGHRGVTSCPTCCMTTMPHGREREVCLTLTRP